MSIVDSLALLGAGAGRGYQASQEIKRQLAEAKIRHMMEQRELDLREHQAAQQDALGSAQIAHLGQEDQTSREALLHDQEARTRGSQPIVPGGGPLHFQLGGQTVDLPNQGNTLNDYKGLFEQDLSNQGRVAGEKVSGEYGLRGKILENSGRLENTKLDNKNRVDNPTVYGGSRTPKTYDEMRAEYRKEVVGRILGQPTLLEGDPDKWIDRIRKGAALGDTLVDRVYPPQGSTTSEPNSTKNTKNNNNKKKVTKKDSLGIR